MQYELIYWDLNQIPNTHSYENGKHSGKSNHVAKNFKGYTLIIDEHSLETQPS